MVPLLQFFQLQFRMNTNNFVSVYIQNSKCTYKTPNPFKEYYFYRRRQEIEYYFIIIICGVGLSP
jgi:hypothetical protein